jgi:hypothetical protein
MCSIKSVFSPFWSILSASSQDVDGGTLRGWWADQERGWASVVVGDWRCSVMMELVGSAASLCNKHGKAFKWLSMRARRGRFASSSAQPEAIFIKHLAFNKSFRLASMCNQSLIIARSRQITPVLFGAAARRLPRSPNIRQIVLRNATVSPSSSFSSLRQIHNVGNPSACVRWHVKGRQPHHGCMTTF